MFSHHIFQLVSPDLLVLRTEVFKNISSLTMTMIFNFYLGGLLSRRHHAVINITKYNGTKNRHLSRNDLYRLERCDQLIHNCCQGVLTLNMQSTNTGG